MLQNDPKTVQKGLKKLALINGEIWFKIDSATTDGINRINQVSGNELSALKRLDIAANHCPTYIQTCVFTFEGKKPLEDDKFGEGSLQDFKKHKIIGSGTYGILYKSINIVIILCLYLICILIVYDIYIYIFIILYYIVQYKIGVYIYIYIS